MLCPNSEQNVNHEILHNGYQVVISQKNLSRMMDVCESGHTFPFLKQLTFYRKEAFDLSAYYANGSSETLIGKIQIFFFPLADQTPRNARRSALLHCLDDNHKFFPNTIFTKREIRLEKPFRSF